ncbi:MAG: beta-galactosidase [Armatimonadota bacterium]|nr:beta-galactosidase [Armatimonadota bacterium]
MTCAALAAVVTAGARPDERRNLLPNPSFEEIGTDGLPIRWRFQDAGAGATLTVDEDVAHTGERSIKLTNPHEVEPHVYGTLWCAVDVQPNSQYTLSLYALSEDPGRAWFGGGEGWRFRTPIEATDTRWRRFAISFTTGEGERSFSARINVDSVTEGLWIDSVQLELGDTPTAFDMPETLDPGESTLQVGPADAGENLLDNGSFERWRDDWPEGWRWDPRNTDATMTRDETRAHSGRSSLRLTNGTRFGAHVYGQLLYAQPVEVEPSAAYTVSAWVQGESPGIGWVGGAERWRVRAAWPRTTTGGRWVRVHETFETLPHENEIRIMAITESPTEGVWVDDVKLERGPEATPFVLEGDARAPELELEVCGRGPLGEEIHPWMPGRYPASEFVFGSELWVTGHATRAAGRTLRVTLSQGEEALDAREQALPDGPCASFTYRRELSDLTSDRVRLEVSVTDGDTIAHELTLTSPQRVLARVGEIEPLVAELRARVEALGERGRYPRVTLTVAEHFLDWIRQDVDHGELNRAWAQAETVERLVQDALAREGWPQAPKFVTSPLEIDGPSFVGEVRWPDGRTERRPVFFVGMGHFGQVRRDADIMPDYGLNIIQIEFGPRHVLPDEESYEDGAIESFLEVCDRAAEAGTQVNLLISPHYFPGWALEKWPHLKDCSGGFLRYCVHAPEARQVLRRYLQYMIPKIAGHPALHSICLTNEPVSTNLTRCRYTRQSWHQWLQERYETVQGLNETWGSEFEAFEEVPVPAPELRPDPLACDFMRFNQQQFAGFHRFLADTIHAMAPEIPVHAKMMICAVTRPSGHGPWSIAPELFAEFCEINGNDATRWYRDGGEWATSWECEIMGFELQRSARDAPVFNSEDHIIIDRDVTWVDPEHIYNVYWQGAVHGRSASTTWVWERTYSTDASTTGSILHRPACVEAAAQCTLDLNRLAPQVTALQRLRPRVALAYSLAGLLWDEDYERGLREAWRATTFSGHKTGFIYERQLEALAEGERLGGYLSAVEVIVLPGLRHLSAGAMRGLERFAEGGGRIIVLGAKPIRDEYDRPRELSAPVAATIAEARHEELMVALDEALREAGVEAPSRLVGPDGVPVYGVEHIAVPWEGGWLVNISNYRHEEPLASLEIEGREVPGGRVLNLGEPLALPGEIPSLQPLLLYVLE